MNNVKANKSAHKESVRDLRSVRTVYFFLLLISTVFSLSKQYMKWKLLNSFCRTDLKFCSCSDDNTVKVWDFARCQEERSLSGNVSVPLYKVCL